MNEKLDEFTDEELIDEIVERGHTVGDESSLEDFSSDELAFELESRNFSSLGGFAEFFGTAAGAEWLRATNPPQEIRDAYWQEFGRIL